LIFGERRGLVLVTISIIFVIVGGSVLSYYWLFESSPTRLPNSPKNAHNTGDGNNAPSLTSSVYNGNNNSGGGSTYYLQLVNAGLSAPSYFSNLSTPQGIRYLADENDRPTYDGWVIEGDFEPGQAWFSANKSGLTISDQTCYDNPYTNALEDCGPYWEFNGDNREESVSSLYAFLYGIPSEDILFSIYAYIPYHSYYQSCVYNVSSTGCSYEGSGPYDSAFLGLIAYGPNLYSRVVVGFAEVCNGTPPCKSNGLSLIAFTSGGGTDISKVLATSFQPNYTPLHKLTIATDRKSFIDMYVDNTLLYSNTAMPVDMNGTSLALNFYQFTSINNETDSTTWSNVTAYKASSITVTGLASGMTVMVSGTNGFNVEAISSGSGVVVIDVSPEPLKLTVNVELNGRTIATYNGIVNAGATLSLVAS
jgi:hypothetical protein